MQGQGNTIEHPGSHPFRVDALPNPANPTKGVREGERSSIQWYAFFFILLYSPYTTTPNFLPPLTSRPLHPQASDPTSNLLSPCPLPLACAGRVLRFLLLFTSARAPRPSRCCSPGICTSSSAINSDEKECVLCCVCVSPRSVVPFSHLLPTASMSVLGRRGSRAGSTTPHPQKTSKSTAHNAPSPGRSRLQIPPSPYTIPVVACHTRKERGEKERTSSSFMTT